MQMVHCGFVDSVIAEHGSKKGGGCTHAKTR